MLSGSPDGNAVSVCSMHQSNSSSVSPFQAKTGKPALAMAHAAWSWVLKMLQLLQVTSAPSSASVSIKHRRLDRHVQAARDAGAGQRLVLAVLLAEGHQARHLVLGELDLLATEGGKPLELFGRAIENCFSACTVATAGLLCGRVETSRRVNQRTVSRHAETVLQIRGAFL